MKKNYLARNLVISCFLKGIGILAILIANFILAKYLSLFEYGLYSYLSNFLTLFSLICLFGSNLEILRLTKFNSSIIKKINFVYISFLISGVIFLIGLLIILFFKKSLFKFEIDFDFYNIIYITILFFINYWLSKTFYSYMRTNNSIFISEMVGNLIPRLSILCVSLLILFEIFSGTLIFFKFYLMISIFIIFLFIIRNVKFYKILIKQRQIILFFKNSSKRFVYILLNSILNLAPVIILGFLGRIEDAAIASVAIKIIIPLSIFEEIMNVIFIPRVSKSSKIIVSFKSELKQIKFISKLIFFFCLLYFIFVFYLGSDLISLIKEDYILSVNITLILILNFIVKIIFSFQQLLFIASDKINFLIKLLTCTTFLYILFLSFFANSNLNMFFGILIFINLINQLSMSFYIKKKFNLYTILFYREKK